MKGNTQGSPLSVSERQGAVLVLVEVVVVAVVADVGVVEPVVVVVVADMVVIVVEVTADSFNQTSRLNAESAWFPFGS